MSTRSSKRRSAGNRATQQQRHEDEQEDLAAASSPPELDLTRDEEEEQEQEEGRPRKRRSTSAAAAAAAGGGAGGSRRSRGPAAAAAGGDDDDGGGGGSEGDAAAAAAAGGAGGGGGGDGGPPRARRQRTQFNQQEADAMMDKIKVLEDEAEAAQDRAADIDVTAQALSAAVSRVVRFLLFKHHEKPGVPVKRQDLLDNMLAAACVDKSSRAAKRLPPVVLPLAAVQLAKCFGLELRELKRFTAGQGGAAAAAAAAAGGSGGAAAATTAAAAGASTYKLMSLLPTELLTRYAQHEKDNQERGFMTVVLALLQLKQYTMDADELWQHLAQFGILEADRDAAGPFGRHPTEMLQSMEQHRYLISTKQPAPNTERGAITVYEWGEAAYDEFGSGAIEGIVDQWLQLENAAGGDDS